jgi:hypothetical protein
MRTGLLVALFPALILLFSPSTAEAKFLLITHGDSIDKVADLTEEGKKSVKEQIGEDLEVGYMYGQFGIFYLNIWTWNGKYVLFAGDEYFDASPEEIAALAGVASVDELNKPWTYTFPPGLLIIVAGILIFVAFALHGRKQASAVAGFMNDSRYQQAVQMMTPSEEEGAPPPRTFEEAVAFLQQQGIPPEEAQGNLQKILDSFASDCEE